MCSWCLKQVIFPTRGNVTQYAYLEPFESVNLRHKKRTSHRKMKRSWRLKQVILPYSSVRNIVALLACSASHYSLFLPTQALPSSATGSGST